MDVATSTQQREAAFGRGIVTSEDSKRIRDASHRALSAYPGPVGQFLSRELLARSEFGSAFGVSRDLDALLTQIEQAELPNMTLTDAKAS